MLRVRHGYTVAYVCVDSDYAACDGFGVILVTIGYAVDAAAEATEATAVNASVVLNPQSVNPSPESKETDSGAPHTAYSAIAHANVISEACDAVAEPGRRALYGESAQSAIGRSQDGETIQVERDVIRCHVNGGCICIGNREIPRQPIAARLADDDGEMSTGRAARQSSRNRALIDEHSTIHSQRRRRKCEQDSQTTGSESRHWEFLLFKNQLLRRHRGRKPKSAATTKSNSARIAFSRRQFCRSPACPASLGDRFGCRRKNCAGTRTPKGWRRCRCSRWPLISSASLWDGLPPRWPNPFLFNCSFKTGSRKWRSMTFYRPL